MIDYLARKEILHDAFFKKYAAKKYMKASIIAREWIRREYTEQKIANISTETKEIEEEQEIGKENTPENDDEDNDVEVSDEDDYMFANELLEREVDDGFQMIS
jgi:hypothetical protein